MRKFVFIALAGATALGLAGCGERAADSVAANAAATGEPATTEVGATASASYPKGARIVDENGVIFRIDPDGTRVQLGPNDSRIVVDNGVRYRVDPSGTRVRIDDQGLDVDVDLPDVDVGINEKGHPDVDVHPSVNKSR